MEAFTAIDFETATGYRNSICQVGLVRVENEIITNQKNLNKIIAIIKEYKLNLHRDHNPSLLYQGSKKFYNYGYLRLCTRCFGCRS